MRRVDVCLHVAACSEENAVDVAEDEEVASMIVENRCREEAERNAKCKEHMIHHENPKSVHGIREEVSCRRATALTLLSRNEEPEGDL